MKDVSPAHMYINLSAPICTKIKLAYYGDLPWDGAVSEDVAKKFSILKKRLRPLHVHQDEGEFLRELQTFTEIDLKEAIDFT